MIRISLSLLILIYLMTLLTVVFGIWLYSAWRRRRDEWRTARYRMRCGICGFIYEDHGDEVLSRCPNCDRLNERFNREAL
jgi:hypothetical protein